ncbi:hypothetical protein Bca101_026186 [Brassica carinata]
MIHLTNGSFVLLISQLRVNTHTSWTTNSMLLFSAMDATQIGAAEASIHEVFLGSLS